VRRWNLDPRPNPTLSAYSCFGLNPIRNVDLLGDTLRLAGNIHKAFEDLLSIVSDLYKPLITLSNNNTIEINSKALQELMNTNYDEGALLLQQMATSQYNYNYQVSDTYNGEALASVNGTIQNRSITPFSRGQSSDLLPTGIDGEVVIAENSYFIATNGKEEKRSCVVFHELAENFERTDCKKFYINLIWSKKSKSMVEDPSNLGAHSTAITRAQGLTPEARSINGDDGNLDSASIK
jgi:hypothetical protein